MSGLYFSSEIAAKTLDLELLDTIAAPFMTRETVAVETPAISATSLKVADTMFSP